MANYRIVVKASAAKELEAMGNRADRRRLVAQISALARQPRPKGCERLSGQVNLYRVRSGNYRVVYELQDDLILVTVIKIGHRKDVYRNL